MLDRETTVRGLDDAVYFSLGSDVGIICAVAKIGKSMDALCSSAVLTGEELLKFLEKNKPAVCQSGWLESIAAEIVPGHRYEISAFDW